MRKYTDILALNSMAYSDMVNFMSQKTLSRELEKKHPTKKLKTVSEESAQSSITWM